MTDEAKALVFVLRRGEWDREFCKYYPTDERNQAADLIETQSREIERLREALAFYAAQCDAPVEGRGDCGMKGNLCCLTARAALGESHDQ